MGNTQRTGSSVRAALAAATITASMGLMALVAPAATAQDAATPAPMPECVAPDLPPGTPTPMDMASPEAMDMMPMPAASPEVEVERSGTAADEATTAEAQAAAMNVVACLNSGNMEGVVALMTTNAMEAEFGSGNPYDVMMFLEGFTFDGFTTGTVYAYDDGSVSVDVQYNQGPYQVVGERWYLVQEDGYWKLDGFGTAAPTVEGDTTVVGVSLTDYAFTFNVSSVVQPEVLQFQVRNDGAELHELILVRMPDGVTIEDIQADPEGTVSEDAFIGAVFLAPGEQTDMVLVGLEPGKYVAICFIPTAEGTPHYAEGMIAEFEVIGL